MSVEGSRNQAKNRRAGTKVFFSILVLVVTVAIWAAHSYDSDGHSLTGVPFRIYLADTSDDQLDKRMGEVGTNALPHLLQILRQTPEPDVTYQKKKKFWNALPVSFRKKFSNWQPVSGLQLQHKALVAVGLFGPDAQSALPEVIRIEQCETNSRTRAGALVAALKIGSNSKDAFDLWRNEWENSTRFGHRDLALYLHISHFSYPGALPFVLKEAQEASPKDEAEILASLENFGENARPAIPLLIKRFAESEPLRIRLLPVFEHLGPAASDAVPTLGASLNDGKPMMHKVFDAMSQKQEAIDSRLAFTARTLQALLNIGPASSAALPMVSPFLTNKDCIISLLAAAVQIQAGGPREEAISVLKSEIEHPEKKNGDVMVMFSPESGTSGATMAAIYLCGQLGIQTSELLPQIKQHLTDQQPLTRVLAARAVWRITGKTNDSLPTLLATLQSQLATNQSYSPDILVFAIDTIAEIGPAASEALPILAQTGKLSRSAYQASHRALSRIQGNQPVTPK